MKFRSLIFLPLFLVLLVSPFCKRSPRLPIDDPPAPEATPTPTPTPGCRKPRSICE